ncbi:aspartic peptidase domain-containing protein, partial [Lipomyces arxii]|uniref:aspartic peptidase domain-containing protein n=1 Tax=Lipomyces arxii TaxID=56418 RepID=UPI0034CD23ED
AGLTNTTAYSIWIDDHDTSTGQILFGGIDLAKFEGELKTVPRTPIHDQMRDAYFAQISQAHVHVNGRRKKVIGNTRTVHAMLNPTRSWSYLPYYFAQRLARQIGGTRFDDFTGTFSISCARAFSQDFVELDFFGVTIPVPLKQLVSKVGVKADGTPICALAFTATRPQAGQIIPVQDFYIGDSILRSAYTVY